MKKEEEPSQKGDNNDKIKIMLYEIADDEREEGKIPVF